MTAFRLESATGMLPGELRLVSLGPWEGEVCSLDKFESGGFAKGHLEVLVYTGALVCRNWLKL